MSLLAPVSLCPGHFDPLFPATWLCAQGYRETSRPRGFRGLECPLPSAPETHCV